MTTKERSCRTCKHLDAPLRIVEGLERAAQVVGVLACIAIIVSVAVLSKPTAPQPVRHLLGCVGVCA